MKHYITNTTLVILALAGIILGAFGSEIFKALFGLFIPSIITLVLGLLLAWGSAVAFINYNTDWIKNY